MADDNRNLENQLNILFDSFDDDDEEEILEEAAEAVSETVSKAEETVTEAVEAVAEEVQEAAEEISEEISEEIPEENPEEIPEEKPEEMPAFTIPAIDLNAFTEIEPAAPAEEPVKEVIPEAPAAPVREEKPAAIDDTVLENQERRISFDDFESVIPEEDDDEAPVAYTPEAELDRKEKPARREKKKNEVPAFVFDDFPDEEEEFDPDYGDEADEDDLDAEYMGETAASKRRQRESSKTDRSALRSVNQNSKRDPKQATRDDLRKETIRFWIFTAIVALIVAGAVLFILNHKGIINLFDRETTTAATTAEPTTEPTTEKTTEATTEATTTEEPTTEETTTEEPTTEAEAGPESVVENYNNMFMCREVYGENLIDTLNVRATPSTDGTVIALLRPYEGGEILADDGTWLRIMTGGIEGYVSKAFTFTGDEAKAIAHEHAMEGVKSTADELNIRIAASTDAEIMEIAKKDTVMELLDEEGDFYKVRFAGDTVGYVSKEFVEKGYYLKEGTRYYAE